MRGYLTALVGNDRVRTAVGEAIERGTLSHAILIEGARGSGKHTLATEIAEALNCERRSGTGPLPCHSCNNCRRIAERNFPDVKYLEKSKDKATIGVGEVSLFKEDMYLSPTESEHKVYIIESSELLTPQAQNALLITLEEPPRGVVIIMLCEQADKLLTTIRSRVQYAVTARFSGEEIEKHLVSRSREAATLARADQKRLKSLIMSADGCIGQALELLDPKRAEENAERREVTEALIRGMTARARYAELLSAAAGLSTKRAELASELESVTMALRDMIAKKMHADAPLLFFTSDEELSTLAKEFELKRLLFLFDVICEAYADNQKNANITTLVTNMTAKIRNGR